MNKKYTGRLGSGVLLAIALGLIAGHASAGPRDQVKRIHDRLAGTPASEDFINTWDDSVAADPRAVALEVIETSPGFYDATLKSFAAPWTNRDRSVFVDLNDYIATVVGMVRNNEDFRSILYANVIYIANPAINGIANYSNNNNNHYEDFETQGRSLMTDLVRRDQSQVTGLPASAAAGVMTTRAAAKAFFIAGTNRANFRFTLVNHLCRDMEDMHDVTRPADRIRQDVTRSPGGDSRIFLNNCIGCHTGMDPMAQAFAYYNYIYDPNSDPDGNNGAIAYNDVGDIDPVTLTRVQAKYHNNETNFEPGYITPDDGWDNYWRAGPHSVSMGWDGGLTGSGSGAASMGMELAHSQAFARCQVEKVFENVCLRPPVDGADRGEIASMMTTFASSNYNLKQVFADAAVYCRGD